MAFIIPILEAGIELVADLIADTELTDFAVSEAAEANAASNAVKTVATLVPLGTGAILGQTGQLGHYKRKFLRGPEDSKPGKKQKISLPKSTALKYYYLSDCVMYYYV